MRTKSDKRPVGRPEKEFNQQIFEGLCRIQCRLHEIAGVMGLSEDTIERRCKQLYGKGYKEAFDEFGAAGLMSLRRYQFKMAETNPTMAIWLGKQYLEQSDKAELKLDVNAVDAEIERRLAAVASRGETSTFGEAESETVN